MPAMLRHLEFAGTAGPELVEFYQQLLDIEFRQETVSGLPYYRAALDQSDEATMAVRHEPEGSPEIVPYFQVDDLNTAIARAESLGGRLRIPVIPIPEGAFCLVEDPEGNPVGLLSS